ncbi:MAG: mechanosensitive ion channel family protein [Pseudolabrys sp.]|nr:mechanosensitive ion channel family protein [Pseudolabrys sp.]
MDFITTTLNAFNTLVAWLPKWVVALSVLFLAVAIAYSLHRVVRRLIRRLLADRYPFGFSIFNQMRGVTRLALIVLALVIAVPLAPLDPGTAEWMARLLLMAIIALIGWMAITSLRIAADVYLRRFQLDAEDNLLARKHYTQVRVLLRTADVLVVIITVGAALMSFESVRQYGVSLFASAGVAGLVAGLAARPVLSNLFAGVQLAMTQPIRIDDSVVVENEWGWIEEINSTYVVIRIWDLRRLIVPLTYFIEKPFQNWTRENASILGTAMIYVDYSAPVGVLRDKLTEIVKASKLWDGRAVGLQVTDVKENVIELRCLMSAANAGNAFNLRCEVRERMVDFLQKEYPDALPRRRAEMTIDGPGAAVEVQTPKRRPRKTAKAKAAS